MNRVDPAILSRIVVPLDGSAAAEASLSEAARFLPHADSELVIVRSLPPAPVDTAAPAVIEGGLEEVQAYLGRMAEGLEERGVRTRVVAELGPAVDVILKTVREQKATLIAMSTHGRTGLTRALMGSVTEQVIRHSPVPVLAVRRPEGAARPIPDERQPFRNILLPLDRSVRSLRALGPAADLARVFGARLLLLHVLEDDEDPETAEAYYRAVEARAGSQGVAVTTLLETGKVAEEILDVARFHDVDIIAMATHGRRGLSRLVTGSVTEGVLRQTFVPVLVVRSQEAATLGGRESVA